MPSQATCHHSIASRTTGHNEWYLSGATAVGIFSFPNPAAFNPGVGETQSGLASVVAGFPGQRIFTVSAGEFHEFDRDSGKWHVRGYGEIITD